MRIAKLVVMLGTFGGLAAAFFGCGTSRPDAASGDGTATSFNDSCSPSGVSRSCKYIVSETNNVRTCAEGSQTCVNGSWSRCSGDGRSAPSLLQSVPLAGGGLGVRNINPATDAGPACANPCDPACTGYNEACGDGGADSGDAGSQTTFPATTLPACGLAPPGTGASCDCTGAAAACGTRCDSLSGCEAIGRTTKTATFECNSVTGLCDFKCESGATCNIDCNSVGTCSTTCLTGSTCNVRCNSVSSCPVNCAPGATCNITLCNSSNCPLSSLGVSATCVSTPPFQIPNVSAPGSTPGFENALLDDPCHPGGSASNCEVSPFGTTADDGRMASGCQADHYCQPAVTGGTGCCQKFQTGQTHGSVASGGHTCATAGPDITMPGVCKTPTGDLLMSICNRGTAPAVGPIYLGGVAPASILPHNAGTAAAPTCLAIGAANYTCSYDGTIAPGTCVNITKNSPLGAGCGGNFATGNQVVMTNGPGAPNVVAECDLDVKDTVSAAQPTQPGCANNIMAFGANGQIPNCTGGFAPTQITEVYTASCNPGQRPKWTTLGWQAITPGVGPARSNIEFFATIQGKDYDGGLLAPVGPQLIGKAWANPSSANYPEGPASCRPDAPTTSPIECPKQLAKTIGAAPPTGAGPNVLYGDTLTLDIFLNPTLLGLVPPTLQNWWISYTCVDYE